MQHKNVLLISSSETLRSTMRTLADTFSMSVLLASPETFFQAINSDHDFDGIVLDLSRVSSQLLEQANKYFADNPGIARLWVVDHEDLAEMSLPMQANIDFILSDAKEDEFRVRLARLLWGDGSSAISDVITVDNLSVNLATYQVHVDDEPVSLTLMEYSLLSFLIMHPGRAYTRETLLHQVWGFNYCGGTRTVDVHVRRLRSKLRAQAAAHIVTVRGVGYRFEM